MEFCKESLTVEEQLNLLKSRGLIVNDFDSVVAVLKRIGYYRLSAYMRIFQKDDNHTFKDNVEFANIGNNRFYYLSMIINYYLQTMFSNSSFETDIINLFHHYPAINKASLGFPADWEHFSVTRLKKHEKKNISNVVNSHTINI